MELIDLYIAVKKYFGPNIQMKILDEDNKEVGGILFGCFFLTCGFYGRYDEYLIGLDGYELQQISFLGESASINTDEVSIKKSFEMVEEYCKLILPDKYLNNYMTLYEHDRISNDNGSRELMNICACREYIKEFFSYKIKISNQNTNAYRIQGLLYDSFSFVCEYNKMGFCSIFIQEISQRLTLLKKGDYILPDKENIRNKLEIIDKECRLRLPDKYLKKYEEIYNSEAKGEI